MKISLGNLEKSRLVLSEKDMEHLLGGGEGVRCGCLYAGTRGGATSAENQAANEAAGLWTVPPDGDSSGSPQWEEEARRAAEQYIREQSICRPDVFDIPKPIVNNPIPRR